LLGAPADAAAHPHRWPRIRVLAAGKARFRSADPRRRGGCGGQAVASQRPPGCRDPRVGDRCGARRAAAAACRRLRVLRWAPRHPVGHRSGQLRLFDREQLCSERLRPSHRRIRDFAGECPRPQWRGRRGRRADHRPAVAADAFGPFVPGGRDASALAVDPRHAGAADCGSFYQSFPHGQRRFGRLSRLGGVRSSNGSSGGRARSRSARPRTGRKPAARCC